MARAFPNVSYMLDGRSPDCLEAIAEMGASWPASTPAVLLLSPPVQMEYIKNLQTFMHTATHLSVWVTINKAIEAGDMHAWGSLLKTRPLGVLSLSIEVPDALALEALHGLQAKAIIVRVPSTIRLANADFHAALAGLVRLSEADTLDCASPQIPHTTIQQLLRQRPHWRAVNCWLPQQQAFEHLAQILTIIDRLTVRVPLITPGADVHHALQVLGVEHLEVNGAMNLRACSQFLVGKLSRLSAIHAHFVLPHMTDGEHQTLLSELQGDLKTHLQHEPLPLTVLGHTPISPEIAQWLITRRG